VAAAAVNETRNVVTVNKAPPAKPERARAVKVVVPDPAF
jgi:hypothetical protein